MVKAILKMDDKETIFKLMETTANYRTSIFGASYESPLRMLIKHMPGISVQRFPFVRKYMHGDMCARTCDYAMLSQERKRVQNDFGIIA